MNASSELPVLADLTLPEPGSNTAHRVFSMALRRSIREVLIVTRSLASKHAWARPLDSALSLARSESPAALATMARDVGVSVWLRCLRPPCSISPEPGERGFAIALAMAAARAGVLRNAVQVRAPQYSIASVSARRATVAAAGDLITIEPGPSTPDAEPRFLEIRGSSVLLATVDGNPLSTREEHPDKNGNAIDLGQRATNEWLDMLADALALIGRHEPDLRREIEIGLQALMPVGYDVDRHLSASFAEAIGQAYLTLHPSALTMAEAIIHEFSHNKIAAALELAPLLHNPWDEHHSPVRPDERPLHGVLLAAHAFVPVARLCQRVADSNEPLANAAREHLRRYLPSNHVAIATLREHAKPSEFGRPLVDELERWASTNPPA